MNGLYIFFLGKPNCKYIILIGVLLSYSRLEMPKHIDSNCWKLPEKTMGPQCSYCSMNTLKSFEWNKKFHLLIDSMLPFQSPQTTPVPSTTKSSNPDTEQTISPTPPDHQKTAITTKTPKPQNPKTPKPHKSLLMLNHYNIIFEKISKCLTTTRSMYLRLLMTMKSSFRSLFLRLKQ